ncbi:hypothetical protein GCM10027449_04910 [Sinomonas notoginsengisoli]|uniref:hypothetical protein n=1 Tax=Sinomonas notoginsengisoli TaxID=1457311 RepID=UPI001F224B28|nr:hypothetical protein [Sinomonas notoginsengisoli]
MTTTARSGRSVAFSCAALALGLVLTGCGSTAAPSAQPSSQSAIAAPQSATAAPQSPTPSPTADLATFTFTSQKLSFRHPATWTGERVVHGDVPRKVEYVPLKDAAGKVVVTVLVNFTSYDVGVPVQRTVLESGALPGLSGGGLSPPLQYALLFEQPTGGGASGGICTLKVGQSVPADGAGVLRGLPPSGPTPADPASKAPYGVFVELGPDVEKCGSADHAKAWWASSEGQQVKALVLSLTAS